jgi:hypothetical protein
MVGILVAVAVVNKVLSILECIIFLGIGSFEVVFSLLSELLVVAHLVLEDSASDI